MRSEGEASVRDTIQTRTVVILLLGNYTFAAAMTRTVNRFLHPQYETLPDRLLYRLLCGGETETAHMKQCFQNI